MKIMRLLLVLLLGVELLTGCAAPAKDEVSDEPTSQQIEVSDEPVIQQTPETTPENENENGSEATTAVGPPAQPAEGKVLVAYFSCTGNTEAIAERVTQHTGADIYQITPVEPYTPEDLDYGDSSSRTTIEQNDPAARPAISNTVDGMESYDTIFLGYPIWWGQAPKIISTFLESYDFGGKTIVPFCTSGSSGVGASDTNLHALCAASTRWLPGERFAASASQEAVAAWVDGLDILTSGTN